MMVHEIDFLVFPGQFLIIRRGGHPGKEEKILILSLPLSRPAHRLPAHQLSKPCMQRGTAFLLHQGIK